MLALIGRNRDSITRERESQLSKLTMEQYGYSRAIEFLLKTFSHTVKL